MRIEQDGRSGPPRMLLLGLLAAALVLVQQPAPATGFFLPLAATRAPGAPVRRPHDIPTTAVRSFAGIMEGVAAASAAAQSQQGACRCFAT